MTIRHEGDTLFLEGRCRAEEAETLLVALQDRPELAIDASALTRAHMAVVQILLTLRPTVQAYPTDRLLAMLLRGQS